MNLSEVEYNGEEFSEWATKLMAVNHREKSRLPFTVRFRSEKYGPFSGVVRRTGASNFEIVQDDSFAHDLALIIRSLLADKQAFKRFGERTIQSNRDLEFARYLSATEEDKTAIRDLLLANLELGVLKFAVKTRDTNHWLCNASRAVLAEDRLLESISKVAITAALGFVLQHELAHIICGHVDYRSHAGKNLRAGELWDRFHGDFYAHEIIADLNAASNLFNIISSLRSEFMEMNYEFDDAVYYAALAGGFGVGAYFLISGAAEINDEYHPPPTDRLIFILKDVLGNCPKIEAASEETRLMALYRRGQHHGFSEAIQMWDARGLKRSVDKRLDKFIGDEFPCINCSDAVKEFMEFYSSLADQMITVDRKMEAAEMFNDAVLSDVALAPYGRPKELADELMALKHRVRSKKDDLLNQAKEFEEKRRSKS